MTECKKGFHKVKGKCVPINRKSQIAAIKRGEYWDSGGEKNPELNTSDSTRVRKQRIRELNKYYKKHRKSYIVSDDVMKNGILIGCHHGLKKKDLYRITNTFKKLLSRHK